VAKGTRLLNVASASESSLGSAGTMEKAWYQADACEVSSRDGRSGVAPMNMFFSGFRAHLKTQAAKTDAHLARLEEADKVGVYLSVIFRNFAAILVALRGMGWLLGAGPGFA
jgi:hypothetical protein